MYTGRDSGRDLFISMSVKDFYKTTTWQRCRAYIMSRDQGLCQDCLKSGRITAAEEVHHIVELTPENVTDPDVALNENNLISLCRECHRSRHGARHRRYKLDELGRVLL